MPKTAKFVRRMSDSLPLQLIAAALISLIFGLFIFKTALGVNAYWPVPVSVIYASFFLLAMLPLIFHRRFDALMLLASALCLCCGMYARVTLLSFQSSDYVHCLLPWTKKLGSLPLKEALRTSVGDNTLPYLYYLTALSRTDWDELLHIKSFSCLFDVILAYVVMRLVMLKTDDARLHLASYLVVLISPTIMMNSAQWAQCDSIYTVLCLISVLAALTYRGRLCAISWTLAFCFKLQAIFILPALCVALFMGRVKVRHLLYIPAVYLATLIPALCSGRSLLSCIEIYFNQTGEYNKLYLNAPSVWRFFGTERPESLNNMAVLVAAGGLILFTILCLSFCRKMNTEQLFKLFFISSLLAPFILPRMHERYFYMAEVLSLVYFMYDHKKWYIPLTITFSSIVGYSNALFGGSVIDEFYIAIAFLLIIASETRALFRELWHQTPDTIPIE